MKKLVCLCLCFSMMLTIPKFPAGFYSFAAGSPEYYDKAGVITTPSNAQRATPSEADDVWDKDVRQSTPSDAKKVIAEFERYDPYGYDPIQTITLTADEKDMLELPDMIKARLITDTDFTELPVTWVCDDDYSDTEYETYSFNMELPDDYILEEQLQADIANFRASFPWVQVNIWSNAHVRGLSIFDQKINMLRTKFPHGKYWNHVGGTNNPDGYTGTPCPTHDNCGYFPNNCSCNSYSNAIQCLGFAYKAGYDVFGSDPRYWTKNYNLDEISVGDIIQLSPLHTAMVIATDPNSDYMRLVEGNYGGRCRINWDRVVTKTSLRTMFEFFRHAPNYDEIVTAKQETPSGGLESPAYETFYETINISGWALCGAADFDVNIYIDQIDADHAIKYMPKDQLTWRPDLNYQGGFDFDYDISKLPAGEHKIILRVYNLESNQYSLTEKKFLVGKDSEPPIITSVEVSDLSCNGYTITCTITDNIGIDRVQFPTWTAYQDQDDLFPDWYYGTRSSGTINGTTVSYRVNTADHNYESGTYVTHIYAFDKRQNESQYGLEIIVPPNIPLTSIALDQSKLTLEEEESRQLTVFYYPADTTDDKTVIWSTSDGQIATVKDGCITAIAPGTAFITAAVRDAGDGAGCIVEVIKSTDTSDDEGSSSGSGGGSGGGSSSGSSSGSPSGGGGGGGSHSTGGGVAGGTGTGPSGAGTAPLPDYVVRGNWTQTEDKNWKFTDSNGVPYLNKWAAIENPYADTASGQPAYDWFFFDVNGNMVTGWHQEGDNLFYLNPNSDGTRGKMVTGWCWIPDQNGVQKCYYFNPDSDGTRGKLVRNSVIDGNIVNEDGILVVNGVVQTK